MDAFERRFGLAGPFKCNLEDDLATRALRAGKVFGELAARVTAFAIVHTTLAERPRSATAKAVREIAAAIPPEVAAVVSDVCFAREWPGTQRSDATALVLFGKAEGTVYQRLVERSGLFWNRFEVFEDLMLFDGDRLAFYVCSHEKFGLLAGDAKWLEAVGARRTAVTPEDRFVVRGVTVRDEIRAALLGREPQSGAAGGA